MNCAKCKNQNPPNARFCTRCGASTSASLDKEEIILSQAAEKGQISVVKELLDRGAKVNDGNDHGDTPLMFAASKGHIEVVKLLIGNGAEADLKNKSGRTALMFASQNGRTEVVEFLLDHGANVNATNRDGTSPLMFATAKGEASILQILLKRGAIIQTYNNNGESPLMVAAEKGHNSSVEILLSHGADVNHKDLLGRTALTAATRNGHTEVVNLLLASGAENEADQDKNTTYKKPTPKNFKPFSWSEMFLSGLRGLIFGGIGAFLIILLSILLSQDKSAPTNLKIFRFLGFIANIAILVGFSGGIGNYRKEVTTDFLNQDTLKCAAGTALGSMILMWLWQALAVQITSGILWLPMKIPTIGLEVYLFLSVGAIFFMFLAPSMFKN